MTPIYKFDASHLETHLDKIKDYARVIGEEIGFCWSDRQKLEFHESLALLSYPEFVEYMTGCNKPVDPVTALLNDDDWEWARKQLFSNPNDPIWDEPFNPETGWIWKIVKQHALWAAWSSVCYFTDKYCTECQHIGSCPPQCQCTPEENNK